jgi:hypothetical protein
MSALDIAIVVLQTISTVLLAYGAFITVRHHGVLKDYVGRTARASVAGVGSTSASRVDRTISNRSFGGRDVQWSLRVTSAELSTNTLTQGDRHARPADH